MVAKKSAHSIQIGNFWFSNQKMVVIKVIEIKTNNTKIIWKQGVFLQHTFLKSFFQFLASKYLIHNDFFA